MEPYNLYWIEEPVATDDIDGSAGVAARSATPIAGYETEIGLYGFRELIDRGAVDIVQPDIAWSGGFSEGRRIAAYAQAHHRMVAPHAFAGAVLLVASLHFAAAIPNGLVLEWDQNPNAIRDELAEGAAAGSKATARSSCPSGRASASSSTAPRSSATGSVSHGPNQPLPGESRDPFAQPLHAR